MMRNAIFPGVGVTAISLLLATAAAHAADTQEVEMNWVSAEGVEESIGTITLEESEHGLLLTPELSDMSPGVYGFHVHENASCEPGENDAGEVAAAQGAGGHYDPDGTDSHEGPYGEGHMGDLPVLTVNEDGQASLPVLAPRLSLDEMDERSLMVHEGGDTYANEPELGGGGGRMACGVVKL